MALLARCRITTESNFMALQHIIRVSGKTVVHTDAGPVHLPTQTIDANCYIKVVSIEGGKSACTATCLCADSDHGITFLRMYEFVPSLEDGAPNFIAQAYLHLKSLPEFAGATDC
jgi:hypothetical protein